MLSNGAPMDAKQVASSLRSYFSQPGRTSVLSKAHSGIFTAFLSSDFMRGASTHLLDRLVDEYSKKRDDVGDVILTYCLIELKARGVKLDFVTYDALSKAFGEERLLQVPGVGSLKIGELDPAAGKLGSVSARGRKPIVTRI